MLISYRYCVPFGFHLIGLHFTSNLRHFNGILNIWNVYANLSLRLGIHASDDENEINEYLMWESWSTEECA